MPITFSVITPSFQQGQFIETTIQSVISQDFPGVDYIVCDGGSRDHTVSILEKYSRHLRWISEPDEGQAHAINKGIAMTSGEIIAWINSDDLYYPQAFKRVADYFETNSDALVVYGQADWIDEFGGVVAPYPTRSWNYKQLTRDCYLCQPAVFFRRSLVEQLGGVNIDLHYCMDYELWLRYGSTTPFRYMSVKLAESRIYPSNKTFGNRLAVHREVNYMLRNTLGYSTRHWIFQYSRLEAEQINYSKRNEFLFVLEFLRNCISNCWYFNKKALPMVLLKIIFYQLTKRESLSEEGISNVLEIASDRTD